MTRMLLPKSISFHPKLNIKYKKKNRSILNEGRLTNQFFHKGHQTDLLRVGMFLT